MKYLALLVAAVTVTGCSGSDSNSGSVTNTTPTIKSCYINGKEISGYSGNIYVYINSSVPYGETCQGERRYCDDGNLSGSALYSSCSMESPKSCVLNGNTITHGQSVVSYEQSIVPYGTTCKSQYRSCNNGSLSGTYTFKTCTVAPAPPVVTPPNPTITVYIKYNAMRRGGCYSSPQQFTCNSSTQTMPLSYLNSFRITNYPYCSLIDKGGNLYEIDCRTAQTCETYYSSGYCGNNYPINYLVGSCSSVYGVHTNVSSGCSN